MPLSRAIFRLFLRILAVVFVAGSLGVSPVAAQTPAAAPVVAVAIAVAPETAQPGEAVAVGGVVTLPSSVGNGQLGWSFTIGNIVGFEPDIATCDVQEGTTCAATFDEETGIVTIAGIVADATAATMRAEFTISGTLANPPASITTAFTADTCTVTMPVPVGGRGIGRVLTPTPEASPDLAFSCANGAPGSIAMPLMPPTAVPTATATATPTVAPSPTEAPTATATQIPTVAPSPTEAPTATATQIPTVAPSPTEEPTATATQTIEPGVTPVDANRDDRRSGPLVVAGSILALSAFVIVGILLRRRRLS